VSKQTPFYDLHVAEHGKMVDFAGYQMPLNYGSQIEEHHQVRNHAGLFDVSHMGIVDCEGEKASDYLRYLLANDVNRIKESGAIYTCMLNDVGCVIDDLIVYKMAPDFFRLVINAGTREKDLHWMRQHAENYAVTLKERIDLVMLAIQGPDAQNKLIRCFPSLSEKIPMLKPFHFLLTDNLFIARTGYTGEDGFELIFDANLAEKYWLAFKNERIIPCGLGARDTLRLEAGLNLYGSDMDETVTPLESNLAWTVAFQAPDRRFIGRNALEKQLTEGVKQQLVGLVLEGPGVIRHHQKVIMENQLEGVVTSGGFSPTLKMSIALARIPSGLKTVSCFVEIRNKQIPARIVKPPFVRNGKKLI
jgi:aminomethyltransferase